MNIAEDVVQLRSSYKNILDYLYKEFEKRGVILERKPRKDFCSLGYYAAKQDYCFASIKIETKNFLLRFNFNSVFRNNKIEDRLVISGRTSYTGNIKASTNPLPVFFLEKEEVLDVLASFLKGEEYNLCLKEEGYSMWEWVHILNKLKK